jgi:hypothetical protein
MSNHPKAVNTMAEHSEEIQQWAHETIRRVAETQGDECDGDYRVAKKSDGDQMARYITQSQQGC